MYAGAPRMIPSKKKAKSRLQNPEIPAVFLVTGSGGGWDSFMSNSVTCFGFQTPANSLVLRLALRQSCNPVARQPEYGPFVHRLCAKRTIKLDGRLVPIEHSPFHPAAAAITRNLRKLDKQRPTAPFPALLRFHEQIFQIEPRPPK